MEAQIYARLCSLQEPSYRAFQCSLMPTVAPETVLGVRTPALRALAKELYGDPALGAFFNALPHRCYEENNLHAFLLCRMKDFGETIRALDTFLPYVDNWATCDSLRPAVFRLHKPELAEKIPSYLSSDHTYTVRFGIGMLMCHYLGDSFRPEYAAMAASVRSQEYYIRMMLAWYFATALALQWESVLPFLTEHRLDPWTHNKAIQKAVESRRITAAQKAYLRTLRR